MIRPTQPAIFVFAGGVLAGTLDIVSACAFWALRAVSSPANPAVGRGRAFGSESFAGGPATVVLGLILHYMIAVSMFVVYYLAARQWAILWHRPLVLGAGYGLLLYVVMNFVVVPLSRAGPGSADPTWIALTVAVHALFVGIPIAALARRAILSGTSADSPPAAGAPRKASRLLG